MIVDFAHHDPAALEADVCIAGAGVAGLLLAAELEKGGARVLVLEGGGRGDEVDTEELYNVTSIGKPNLGVDEGRYRLLGGTSTRWGGQLLPLEASDYTARKHVAWSGWPIGPADVEPFIARAMAWLGVDDTPFDSLLAEIVSRPVPEFDPERLWLRFSKWVPWQRRNVAKVLRRELRRSENLRLLLHANVVEVLLHPNGRSVAGLRIKAYAGRETIARARAYVVACGTLEAARLLLASRSVLPYGIGNQRDLVGRFFQDHLSVRAARLLPHDRRAFMSLFQPFFHHGALRTSKIVMSSSEQSRRKSLAALGHIVFDLDLESPLAHVRSLLQAMQRGNLRELRIRHLFAMGRALPDIMAGFFARFVLGLRPVPTRAIPFLQIDCEQLPRPESRVYLGEEPDGLGMPRLIVDWRWGEEERHSIRSFAETFAAEWRRLDLGEIEWNTDVLTGSPDMNQRVRDIYHQCGTTRMSDDPNAGVLDGNLRVHGVENLFVASCSAFPTVGCGNPTLTLMALAVRLADHLKARRL